MEPCDCFLALSNAKVFFFSPLFFTIPHGTSMPGGLRPCSLKKENRMANKLMTDHFTFLTHNLLLLAGFQLYCPAKPYWKSLKHSNYTTDDTFNFLYHFANITSKVEQVFFFSCNMFYLIASWQMLLC